MDTGVRRRLLSSVALSDWLPKLRVVGSSPIARFGCTPFCVVRSSARAPVMPQTPHPAQSLWVRANRGSRDHDEVTEIQVSPTGDEAKDAARRFAEFAGFRRERVRLVGPRNVPSVHAPLAVDVRFLVVGGRHSELGRLRPHRARSDQQGYHARAETRGTLPSRGCPPRPPCPALSIPPPAGGKTAQRTTFPQFATGVRSVQGCSKK